MCIILTLIIYIMKQKLLLILLVTFSAVKAQETTHVDFDTNNPNIVFNSWNTSSTFSKVSNPVSDATNSSAFVGQFTAGNDNGYWNWCNRSNNCIYITFQFRCQILFLK